MASFLWLSQPLPPSRLSHLSYKVYSEEGEPLASRTSVDGYWRLPAKLDDIDPKLVKFLVAYEDKRFWSHIGVDPIALARASWDLITSGEVKSGASTLTMQTARLLYPELAKKTILTKLKQMAVAIKIEYHWSKEQILEAYFTLAPYGGNIEGIITGSEAWLSRNPKYLTDREAALFVALPQSPESRRPDKHPSIAEQATSRVLYTIAGDVGLSRERLKESTQEPLPLRVGSLSYNDQHLIDRLMSFREGELVTTINNQWQSVAQSILKRHVEKYPEFVNGSVMVIERRSGDVKVYVGSEGYHNKVRKGAINYLTTPRSPGSTLKPLIYGMALNRNLLKPNSVLQDSEIQVAGYAPTNFDDGFHGNVTLRDALIQSLNIPAIQTLNQLGAELVDNQIRRYLELSSDQSNKPGLSLAVGGLYLTAENIANLYLGITEQPSASINFSNEGDTSLKEPLISSSASSDLLSLMTQVDSSGRRYILKTGTSNGKRDAWSIYVTQDHIVLVWLGTADNQITDELVGVKSAAPIGQDLIANLDLDEPQYSQFVENELSFRIIEPKECARLIQYPENDELVVITGNRMRVSASVDSLIWYLDGERTNAKDQSLPIDSPGAHVISARVGNCITNHKIYVEIH
nr:MULTISPECIES: penicillin-binding protein 1C [unclassified Marinobacterium]